MMKTNNILVAAIITGGLLTIGATANAADHQGHSDAKAAPKAKLYPLKPCVVSGEELGSMGKPYVFVHEGQEFQLCCKGCLKDFNKQPAKFVQKLKEAEKRKPYPLKTCAVSGEELGSMGKPHVFVYEGQEFQLCCKGCLKDFNKEPAKYVKKLEQAEKVSKPAPAAPKAPAHNHSGHQH